MKEKVKLEGYLEKNGKLIPGIQMNEGEKKEK